MGAPIFRFLLALGLVIASTHLVLAETRTEGGAGSTTGVPPVQPDGPFVPRPADASSDFGRGLLWRIEGGRSGPSWLFGTIHVEDPRVNELPAPVAAAFNDSESLTTEALLDVEQLLMVGAELLLTDGDTLPDLIGEELFAKVAQAMQERGLLPQIAALLKPWAIAVLLSQPPAQSGMFMDRRLYELAQQRGKAVFGLETLSEQLQVFDAMTIDDQVVLLEETLAHIEAIPEMIEQLTQAYLDRDLARLTELANEQFSQSRAHARLGKELLSDRNVRMVVRMQPRISEGNAFIAVGALHLPGPDGLLSRLHKQGYTLTRVY